MLVNFLLTGSGTGCSNSCFEKNLNPFYSKNDFVLLLYFKNNFDIY